MGCQAPILILYVIGLYIFSNVLAYLGILGDLLFVAVVSWQNTRRLTTRFGGTMWEGCSQGQSSDITSPYKLPNEIILSMQRLVSNRGDGSLADHPLLLGDLTSDSERQTCTSRYLCVRRATPWPKSQSSA